MTKEAKEQCKHLDHDFENAKRLGRAHYVCPKCDADISMILFMAHQADVNLLNDKKND